MFIITGEDSVCINPTQLNQWHRQIGYLADKCVIQLNRSQKAKTHIATAFHARS